MQRIRIGTRGSRLALAQIGEVVAMIPDVKYEVSVYNTKGDLDKNTPIDGVAGSDFFTDVIDKALLDKKIDLAVHSAKDLPEKVDDGLEIAVFTKPIDSRDVLVSKNNLKLSELVSGSRIGTSSYRRKKQIQMYRKDLSILDIRGNVDERLNKLDSGEYEAIVVARAALIRLGLENRATEILPFGTAWGQGSLALVIRETDKEFCEWLRENLKERSI